MRKRKKQRGIKTLTADTRMGLGEKLRLLRDSRKFSQQDLAKAAKLSQATIAQIETGKKDPSIETLRKLGKALDIHVATLFVEGDVHVFDLPRLRRKYTNVDGLTPALYMALGKVVQFAKDIKFI